MKKTPEHSPCSCGNVWFALDGQALEDGTQLVAAVTIGETGAVSSFTGDLVCTRCGRRYESPAELWETTNPDSGAATGTDGRPQLRLIVNNDIA